MNLDVLSDSKAFVLGVQYRGVSVQKHFIEALCQSILPGRFGTEALFLISFVPVASNLLPVTRSFLQFSVRKLYYQETASTKTSECESFGNI